jgi:hypothetical protein
MEGVPVSGDQAHCLILMFCLGVCFGLLTAASWSDLSKTNRRILFAWTALWIGPPLYFLWTKGAMG